MRKPGPNVRLFVAVHPPLECREAYLGALGGVGLPAGGWRVTPVEQVHLTLQFIGHVAEKEMDEIAESVERSAAGVAPFRLEALRLVTFPERGAARLVALELDAPAAILEVKRRLVQRLARHVRGAEHERFRPHITLCRFTEGRGVRVGGAAELPGFEAREIVLFRSVLRPGGAVHSEVMRAGLTGKGGSERRI